MWKTLKVVLLILLVSSFVIWFLGFKLVEPFASAGSDAFAQPNAKAGPPARIYFAPGKLTNSGKYGRGTFDVNLQSGIKFRITHSAYEPLSIPRDADFVFTVLVLDQNGNITEVLPKWRARNPEIISITPLQAMEVTVRGISKGSTDIIIEADGLSKVIESLTVE